MSSETPQRASGPVQPLAEELANVKSHWWCFLLLGIVMAVLGVVAVGSGITTYWVSVLTVAVFGFLLLFAGVAQIVSAFWAGRWSGFLVHLLVGILYAVVGYLIVDSPKEGALTLTLVLAALLIVGGIFRVVAALTQRFHGWGWVILNGLISVLLGVMINEGWPDTGLFVIGLFVGIELLLNGFAWIMFSLELRRAPIMEE